MTLFTVGHGALRLDAFGDLLQSGGLGGVVDVRRLPSSRRNPQFNRAHLAAALHARGIGYRWREALGGRRSPRDDSPNYALRDEGFRGYADHMAGSAFRSALAEAVAEADEQPTAVLCAESLWWRCHRRLIADFVTLLSGIDVVHLLHDGRQVAHRLTDGARVAQGALIYDLRADRPGW